MKKKWTGFQAVLAILLAGDLFAMANAPIQRIDVANLLSSGGSGAGDATLTAVDVAFDNGGTTPCYTTRLAFQGDITVFAGADEACIAPVRSVIITPVAGPIGLVYEAPAVPTVISEGVYVTQLIISQDTPPTFDASNGALLISGRAKATSTSYVTGK